MEPYNTTKTTRDRALNRSAMTLAILLALAVLATAVFAYLWMSKTGEVDRLQQSVDTNARKLKAMDEQMANDSDGTPNDSSDTPATTEDDDSDMIVKMVGAYAHTRVSDQSSKLSVRVTKKELPFARVSVSGEEGTGYACVLKKSDGLWVVLFCGQGTPMQSELDQWGVPASIIES